MAMQYSILQHFNNSQAMQSKNESANLQFVDQVQFIDERIMPVQVPNLYYCEHFPFFTPRSLIDNQFFVAGDYCTCLYYLYLLGCLLQDYHLQPAEERLIAFMLWCCFSFRSRSRSRSSQSRSRSRSRSKSYSPGKRRRSRSRSATPP